ncbi:MAG: hypothetical protein R3229_09180 [Alphaproteobacteria bacterium]|nr:hypothetical protein [Alphaproteobacteria bacterium]
MNEYFIEHRIDTLAELFEPFEFRGFTFEQWAYSQFHEPEGNAWRASKVVNADNVDGAFSSFIQDLIRIVDRLSFISQCFTLVERQPFIVMRLNDNSGMRFFFYGTVPSPGVPLSFEEDEIAALAELEKYEEKGDFFRCLREATNATSFYTRFAMLTSALEAMAGEKTTGKDQNKFTDKGYIRSNIIRDEKLYANIFGYGTGIRNVMLHGGKIDWTESRHDDFSYIADIYRSILNYFREFHSININNNVVNPMRTPTGDYEIHRLWLEPRDKSFRPTLTSVHEAFISSPQRADEIEGYDILGRPPPSY